MKGSSLCSESQKYKESYSNLISESGTPISYISILKTMSPDFNEKLFNHDGCWNVFPKLVVRKKPTVSAARRIQRDITAGVQSTLFEYNAKKGSLFRGYNDM